MAERFDSQLNNNYGYGVENLTTREISIEDPEEARAFIKELFDRGERPIVTIPEEYETALRRGLEPHTTWIPGFNMIAGTIGREPYRQEKRVTVRLTNIDVSQVSPRFTGPDKRFHGVVLIEGPIDPGAIEIQH